MVLIKAGFLDDVTNVHLNTYQKKKMKSLISFKNDLRKQWGWKEPETCLFIDEYHKYIPEAYYLIVYRRPEEVIDSLLRRDQKKYINKFKEQGIKGKIKIYFKDQVLKDTLIKLAKNYTEKYIHYNSKILEFADKLPDSNKLIFDINNID